MKKYGDAVLVALQAQFLSSKEIEDKIYERRFMAVAKGGDPNDWLTTFWHNMTIIEAQRIKSM